MDISNWWSFLLIFVRITAFMITAPVFSGRQIPVHYKLGLSVMLTVLCVGVVKEPTHSFSESTIVIMIFREILVGIVLGLVGMILLYSVQLAGTLMDLQIGFSMASLFDPNFGMNTQLTGRLKNILAILFLFSTNAHHLLIQGILSSFDWISLQSSVPAWMDGRLSTFLLECVNQMFIIGFLMAAPIIGTLFVVDVAFGILAKTVPQMNFLAVAPPIKILMHFLIYIFILPSFFYLLKILFESMFDSMFSILKILGA